MTELQGPPDGNGWAGGGSTSLPSAASAPGSADGKPAENHPDAPDASAAASAGSKGADPKSPDPKNATGGAAAPPPKKANDNRPPNTKESGSLNADKASESKPDKLEPSRPTDQERLIYRPIEQVADRPRHRHPVERADHFRFLRSRLQEVVARDESDAVVVLGLRHESGLPHELIASLDLGQVHVRGDLSGWRSLKERSFDDLFKYFVDAASDSEGDIIFVDRIPLSEKSGDIERLIDGVYDKRMEDFEARLKERRFQLFLIVTIDRPIGTTLFLNANSHIRCLPWTDLWLSDFAHKQALPISALFANVSDALQRAAKWHGYEDDDREKMLSLELQELARKSYGSMALAVAAIQKAIARANDEMADEQVLSERCRKDLGKHLGSSQQTESVDPIRQIMLAVAAFAGGTRVGEYYTVCRKLLPDGPAEILRLPSVTQEDVIREAQSAERMNRDPRPLPGWEVVFEHECDAALRDLGINVREGQAIELDSKWKVIDLKRVIAHEYPGLINAFIRRVRERRLLLNLSEAESSLLVNVICAIRDACEEGFNDEELADALTGAQRGLSDIGAPHDIVATMFPGRDPEHVLELVANIERHRHLAQSLDAMGESNPELERYLQLQRDLYPEVTPDNFYAKFDNMLGRLREDSVRRLTRHVLRMRKSSSAASEKSRPIVPSMLDILESSLSSETYVAMLTYMVATSSELDPADIGRRLQREFTGSGGEEIILAIHYRLRQALDSPTAPHRNWLLAFDPLRAGKAPDDRIRALAVFVWDMVINYDVLWRTVPYGHMKHLRIARRLFGERAGAPDPGTDVDIAVDPSEGDEALIEPLVNRFLAQDPGDWLNALGRIDEQSRFQLVQNVKNRIEDVVWVIMTGAAEADWVSLQKNSNAMAGDLLVSLTAGLKLGFERDFYDAAEKVVEAGAEPNDIFKRKWLLLYGLFWPAIIAHWRFTAFGVEPFEEGSEAERRFRALLDRLVEAAPQRARAFRDGFEILRDVTKECAGKIGSRASATAKLYRLKADRFNGLARFFAGHAKDLPVVT